MKKNTSIFFILAALFSDTGCSDSKKIGGAAGNQALYQSAWKPVEIMGITVPGNSNAVLSLKGGQVNLVSGSTGCNRINGTFVLSDSNHLLFSPLATTKMACVDPAAAALENKFLEALSKTTTWQISGTQLTLLHNNELLAKFQAQQTAAVDASILNGTWELNYISGPKIAFDGLFPNKKPTLIIELPKEIVTGNGGCNGYSCPVKVNGNQISFGDALSTMMACEGNGEPLYFKALKTVSTYSIDNNTLTLLTANIAIMRFTKK